MSLDGLTKKGSGTYVVKDRRNILDKVTGLLFNWFYRKVEAQEGVAKVPNYGDILCYKIKCSEWNHMFDFVLTEDAVLFMAEQMFVDPNFSPKITNQGWHLPVGPTLTIIVPLRFSVKIIRVLKNLSEKVLMNRLLSNIPKMKEAVESGDDDSTTTSHTVH